MDELRKQLDEEARRVAAPEDALGRVKRQVERRRVTRQIGTGALALAVAGAGFGVAYSAFGGGPGGRPLVGPSGSISPQADPMNILVVASSSLEDEGRQLGTRLTKSGYPADVAIIVDGSVPSLTVIRYSIDAREEAEAIRRDFLPGAEVEIVSWQDNRGDIRITLGADYGKVAAGTIQVRILDAGGGRAATDTAAGQLRGAGYDVVEVGDAPSVYEETIVACAPQHDEAGLRILEQFFPSADFRGEIPSPDHDVTVYVASDWYGG